MPWAVAAAAIGAGGSIIGGMNSASASKEAAGQAAAAQQQALNFTKQVYGDTTGNLQPYMTTGQNALQSLQGFYGLPGGNPGGAMAAYDAYTQTPGYQFQFQQGLLGANRGLAASGLTGSGAQGKALTQYGQGYASSNFNNYLSALGQLAGMGQSAATGLGQIGTQTSGQVAGSLTNQGNALAAGTMGANNAMNTGISGAAGALGGALNNSGVQNYLSGLGSSSYSKPSNASGV